jgi:uracil-DNA glycosylase
MLENRQSEINSPTWREMRKLFGDSDLDLDRCFFSNVYMGLRDVDKMTGVFPGSKDKGFVTRNLHFLRFQINTVNPKVIITLGKPASINLSLISAQLVNDWAKGKALSSPNNGLKRNVTIDGNYYICVALENPSMRNQNVKRRRYENENGVHTGNEAEIEMIRDALELYG